MSFGRSTASGRTVFRQDGEKASYENMGDGWPLFIAMCRWFPDFLSDILWAKNAPFELSLIQRMMLRINARYRDVDITGCRGGTKSFVTYLGADQDLLLWPSTTIGMYGPSIKQSISIARKLYDQLKMTVPVLTNMLDGSVTKEKFAVTTPYGSLLSVEAFRGNTMHWVIAEETAQEERPPFDWEEFRESVIPQVRADYRIKTKKDPAFVRFKQHSITSAGRRQNAAYESRRRHRISMIRGDSAFVLDFGYEVVLLCQMRDPEWAEKQKEEVGVSGWPREMESIYSGTDKNPLIRDQVIDESRQLLMMEEHHCCKDRDSTLRPEDVIYIIGYDVSYRDSKPNAMCAAVVLKCTKQKEFFRKDRYLKEVVWIEDWRPSETPTPRAQAERVRRIWNRFCYEGSQTYIALDAWQYGDGVLCSLMDQPLGGASPLCCYEHCEKTELELEYAVPCIKPIRAGGTGVTDPDSEMVKNAQMQFEYNNVRLLTANLNDGIEAYKRYHRMKGDGDNFRIAAPYKKTNELIQQIQNLREQVSGSGVTERRILQSIQRDSWSALKYALRMAQILEKANLQRRKKKSDYDPLLKAYKNRGEITGSGGRTVGGRRGGRLF